MFLFLRGGDAVVSAGAPGEMKPETTHQEIEHYLLDSSTGFSLLRRLGNECAKQFGRGRKRTRSRDAAPAEKDWERSAGSERLYITQKTRLVHPKRSRITSVVFFQCSLSLFIVRHRRLTAIHANRVRATVKSPFNINDTCYLGVYMEGRVRTF